MNINNIILISICVILIIYYYNLNIKTKVESFQDNDSNDNDSNDNKLNNNELNNDDLNNNQLNNNEELEEPSFDDYLTYNNNISIYEKSLISKGLPFACSVLPFSKYFNHSYCGDTKTGNNSKKNIIFPVHIIINHKGNYLGLFNDGLIRKKDSINNDFWNNPLDNSVANQTKSNFGSNDQIVPMRMIGFDGSNNLIGVGFDNKLYIKNDPSDADSDSNTNIMMKKDKTYENRWIQRSEPFINKDIIYILYKQNNQNITIDINNSKDIALVIDTNGDLFYFSYNNSEDMTLNPITTNLSLIKIYFDQYGYLLGISSDLKLYRSRKQIYFDNTYEDPKNKDLSEIGNDIIPNEILFDEDKPNPTPVLDIIYDYDSRLFGLGIFPARKRTILMKQKYECSNCFFSTAFGFSHEVNNFYSKKDDIKLSKEDILKLKSGYDIGITQIKKYPELNDINAAYQKSSLNARKTLRKYCQKYNNNNRNSNTQSFEMISRIEEQEKKIDELNKSIAQMIQFDPDKKKIQEDIGIYSF